MLLHEIKVQKQTQKITCKIGKVRPVGFLTCLIEFSKTHREVFDLLQRQFSHTMSVTQIIEAVHQFEKD